MVRQAIRRIRYYQEASSSSDEEESARIVTRQARVPQVSSTRAGQVQASSSSDDRSLPAITCPTCTALHPDLTATQKRIQRSNQQRRAQRKHRTHHLKSPFQCEPQNQCSHRCQLVFVSAHCPICVETVGSPVVTFPCGHVVCKCHFHDLGGRIGDGETRPEAINDYDDGPSQNLTDDQLAATLEDEQLAASLQQSYRIEFLQRQQRNQQSQRNLTQILINSARIRSDEVYARQLQRQMDREAEMEVVYNDNESSSSDDEVHARQLQRHRDRSVAYSHSIIPSSTSPHTPHRSIQNVTPAYAMSAQQRQQQPYRQPMMAPQQPCILVGGIPPPTHPYHQNRQQMQQQQHQAGYPSRNNIVEPKGQAVAAAAAAESQEDGLHYSITDILTNLEDDMSVVSDTVAELGGVLDNISEDNDQQQEEATTTTSSIMGNNNDNARQQSSSPAVAAIDEEAEQMNRALDWLRTVVEEEVAAATTTTTTTSMVNNNDNGKQRSSPVAAAADEEAPSSESVVVPSNAHRNSLFDEMEEDHDSIDYSILYAEGVSERAITPEEDLPPPPVPVPDDTTMEEDHDSIDYSILYAEGVSERTITQEEDLPPPPPVPVPDDTTSSPRRQSDLFRPWRIEGESKDRERRRKSRGTTDKLLL